MRYKAEPRTVNIRYQNYTSCLLRCGVYPKGSMEREAKSFKRATTLVVVDEVDGAAALSCWTG
jgi:hypothetical protein